MKLKTTEVDGKTYAEIQDGKPVYVEDSGKEIAFDAPHATQKISQLNGEAKGHREAKEKAENALKAFDGIEDPAAAIKAIATIKNLDDKKLIDAGEVEKVKGEVSKAFQEKLDAANKETDGLRDVLNKELIGGAFSRSKFIDDEVAVPRSLIQSEFSKNFSLEDGKVIAKDANGNQVFSKEKPGEPAEFDEAIGILIDAHPDRGHLLKSLAKGGGGKPPGVGGSGGDKTMTRTQYDQMAKDNPAAARKAVSEDGVKVVND